MLIEDLRINLDVIILSGQDFKQGQIGKVLVIDASHETPHVTLLIDDGEQAPYESSGFTLGQIARKEAAIENGKTLKNPSAFPRPYSKASFTEEEIVREQFWEQDGMTLRDWFAGMALTAMGEMNPDNDTDHAKYCYELADSMLKKREKLC